MNPSPLTRHCTSCDADNMVATKRRWTGFGYEDDYECPACDYKIALPQAGMVGLQILVVIFGSFILTWFWVIDNNYADMLDYGFVIFIWLIGAFSCLPDALRLRSHRATGFGAADEAILDQAESNPPSLSQTISYFFSKFGGVVTPIIAVLGVIAILALAALIGYVKDYVL